MHDFGLASPIAKEADDLLSRHDPMAGHFILPKPGALTAKSARHFPMESLYSLDQPRLLLSPEWASGRAGLLAQE
jgi:hypothetical protein